uniref:BPTI/Kunitz inhibitor domain-containing protein n=2 Tax=Ixodes ricinus TaxID=34613 RepID=V5ICI4_IXORI
MQRNILWIFVVAAFGINSNVTNGDKPYVCTLGPYNAPGRMYSPGWFYDRRIDTCVYYVFGDGQVDTDKFNRFSTESECNRLCRSHVPSYCFMQPGDSRGRASHRMWTYNSKNGSCNPFIWGGDHTSGRNIFGDKSTCERRCRDSDMGECGKKVACRHKGDGYFGFNDTIQKCYYDNKNQCQESENAFQSLGACYRQCARFVTNKCELPIQNISLCAILETRYGYNKDKNACEEILGCDDGGNSFPTAKKCWTTCAKGSGSRCLMTPDKRKLGKWIGRIRWYYDIDRNKCEVTRQTSIWKGTGNTNLFATKEECEKLCKPVH